MTDVRWLYSWAIYYDVAFFLPNQKGEVMICGNLEQGVRKKMKMIIAADIVLLLLFAAAVYA